MIGNTLTGDVITCTAGPDDVIVAIHPNKFFITAESTNSVGATFFLDVMYSIEPTGKLCNNANICSDGGASMNAIIEAQQEIEEEQNQEGNA